MDDERIRQLADEVLAAIRGPGGTAPPASLEARVAALEAEVRAIRGSAPTVAAAAVVVTHAHSHPSLRVLNLPGGGEGRCILEPDKPCEKSGMCRVMGH